MTSVKVAAAHANNFKTLSATALLAALWLIALISVTGGFRYWTYESLRERDVKLLALSAPPSHFHSSTGNVLDMWDGSHAYPVYIVDFIYTSCPTTCQVLGSYSEQLQRELATSNPAISLLSVSIDIDRDNQTRLGSYAARFNADPKYWQVVVPDDKRQLKTLLDRLRIIAIPDGLGGFTHNGDLQVLDSAGRIRGLFRSSDWRAALTLARSLAIKS